MSIPGKSVAKSNLRIIFQEVTYQEVYEETYENLLQSYKLKAKEFWDLQMLLERQAYAYASMVRTQTMLDECDWMDTKLEARHAKFQEMFSEFSKQVTQKAKVLLVTLPKHKGKDEDLGDFYNVLLGDGKDNGESQ